MWQKNTGRDICHNISIFTHINNTAMSLKTTISLHDRTYNFAMNIYYKDLINDMVKSQEVFAMKKALKGLASVVIIGTVVTIWELLFIQFDTFPQNVALIIQNSYYIVPYVIVIVATLVFPERTRNMFYILALLLTLLAYTTHFLNVFHTLLETNSPYANEIENLSLVIEKMDKLFRLITQFGIDKVKDIITDILNRI